jgi:hypothetical protein
MNLPRLAIAEIADGRAPFFASIAETHTQPGNIERVADSEADATCVDCVTYAFFCRHRPNTAERVRVLAVTQSTPSIPFVTSIATPDDVRLRCGMRSAPRQAQRNDATRARGSCSATSSRRTSLTMRASCNASRLQRVSATVSCAELCR